MQCTAKSKRSGERCRAHALKGKDVCRMHQGRPVVHGLRSKYRENLVGAKIEEILEDPDLLDMRRPVALIEALAQKLITDASTSGIINQETREALLRLATEQSKAIERFYRVTEGTKYVITGEHIQVFLVQVAAVINEEISDPKTRARIAERMGDIRVVPF